jgi:hypothetical protein
MPPDAGLDEGLDQGLDAAVCFQAPALVITVCIAIVWYLTNACIVHVKPFTHNGKQRYSLTLMRRKGKIKYNAVLYENGSMSNVVSMGAWSFKEYG